MTRKPKKTEKEALAHNLKVSAGTKKIEMFLKRQDRDEFRSQVGEFPSGSPRRVCMEMGVKLPKVKIKPFDGDISEWKPFIDTFEAVVDKKDNLSNIEKFMYLRGYLHGSALQSSFPLSHENNKAAVKLLKERYGNKQLIISTHMNN